MTVRVRTVPATTVTAIVTAVIGFPVLLLPGLVTALQQDPARIVGGQVWRLITPVLIQGFGVGQYLFNLAGIVLVGSAVELRIGWARWLGVFAISGVGTIIVTSIAFPSGTDSGASAAVAGLIGALLIETLRTRTLPGWPAYVYATFFEVYLTALALGGPIAGALVGSIALPVSVLVRRFAAESFVLAAFSLVVIGGTVVLAVRMDAHGVGAGIGMLVVGLVLRPGGLVSFLLVFALVAVASTGGVLAMMTAASASGLPVVFLTCGQVMFATLMGLGACWLQRRDRPGRRPGAAVAALGVAVVLAGAFWVVGASPRTAVESPAAAVAGQQYWQLPTGSRLRVVEIGGKEPRRDSPVVFVHGGPGTPDLPGDSSFFGRLAASGFDVYVFDGIGSGGSARLADVAAYTLDRDVADLEAIRRRIGAPRLILIGHSYGAVVVAAYLAAHGEHVERAVFSSPGSLDPTDATGGNVTSRLDTARRADLYARLMQPRNLLVYGLLQINPDAAHSLAGDREMDAQNDAIYASAEPALHCRGHALSHPPTDLGFYRLQYPQSATAAPAPDLRPALRGNATPVLVIKGRCDYLSWRSALTYTDTFAGPTLVYLNGGHNAYQDDPVRFLDAVRAFLVGGRPSTAIAPTRDPPPGYQGPP